jgi:DNA-directed RNA polymerase subunit L
MAKLTVDLPEDPPLAARGWHPAEVTAVKLQTGGDGHTILNVLCHVVEDEDCGAVVYAQLHVTAAAVWKVQKWLRALGFSACAGHTDIDTDEWIGRRVRVKVRHQQYNTCTYAEACDFRPAQTPSNRGACQ